MGQSAGGRRRFLQACLLGSAAGLVGCGAPQPAPGSFFANFQGLELLDQDGRPLAWRGMLGRMVLVNFVYTGCSTVCPIQTQALLTMQQRLPQDLRPRLRLLSVSLDPRQDTPEVLKAFAQRMGADLPGWRFATGRIEDIERLSQDLRLFRPGPDVRKPEDHNTALWLVDPQGMVRFRYSGNPPDIDRLTREIAVLDRMGPLPRA